ncbi:MAG: endonuclease MutS2 [Peptostreptococcales bacterium]
MNSKTLKALEYHKIKEMLIEEAVSQMGKEQLSKMMPDIHINRVREKLSETSEASSLLSAKGRAPLNQLYDNRASIYRAEKGGSLIPKQLLEILYNLRTTKEVKNYIKEDEALDTGIIRGLMSALITNRNLEDEIDRCIVSENEIADAASTDLKNIRRKISSQNEAIKSKLNSIVTSSANKEMLQDALVTVRKDRYVIPVKQEYRSKFGGIIHDQSSTGATLFIEPMSIVNMNNELKELYLKEEKEIERILVALSNMIAENSEALLANQEILVKLDCIFAKGKLSNKMKGIEPKLNERGYIRINQGRHPLLDKKVVVPTNIKLGDDFDTLVITGPNTGGKTVTLKTVGLFILMTQSGLHIPAEYGTEMGIFKKVFADIGDEQSIEQSLSTFSAHMTNIVDIMKDADDQSAVFLDELGAGTDPTEGAALAMALLEYLYQKGVKTIATTHYTELKKYALVTEGVENASMEFDVKTLSPTFKLLIGVPGKSNAFEISQKLGLDSHIIDEARKLVENEHIAFEDVITSIEEDKREAETERDEAIQLKIQIKHLKEELESEKSKLKDQKEKVLQEAKEEARRIVKEAKAFTDEAYKKMTKIQSMADTKERNRDYEELRKSVRNEILKNAEGVKNIEVRNTKIPKDLRIGETVEVLTLGQKGEIVTLPDKNGDLTVQAGLMKINVNVKQLRKFEDESNSLPKGRTSLKNIYHGKTANISPQVDVRGQLLDEAIMNVDKYIDDAFLAGLKQAVIIHGKGEGILRAGIQDFLKSNRHVESYRTGGYSEGGEGATIIMIK